MKIAKGMFGIQGNMFVFGEFERMPYGKKDENFTDFVSMQNDIPKDLIVKHIKSLKPFCTLAGVSFDIFNKNTTLKNAGFYKDGDFLFPTDFLYYLENYDIGVPKEYEDYLQKVFATEKSIA